MIVLITTVLNLRRCGVWTIFRGIMAGPGKFNFHSDYFRRELMFAEFYSTERHSKVATLDEQEKSKFFMVTDQTAGWRTR